MRRNLLTLFVIAFVFSLPACQKNESAGAAGNVSTGNGDILVGEYGSLTGPPGGFMPMLRKQK